RNEASGFENAAIARDTFGKEVLGEFGQARDDADMLTLDVEEQRAADRIFAGSNGLQRGRDAVDSGNLERVAVLVIEGETENADGVLVSGQARQRFGVITSDFDNHVLTEGCDSGFGFFLGEAFREAHGL